MKNKKYNNHLLQFVYVFLNPLLRIYTILFFFFGILCCVLFFYPFCNSKLNTVKTQQLHAFFFIVSFNWLAWLPTPSLKLKLIIALHSNQKGPLYSIQWVFVLLIELQLLFLFFLQSENEPFFPFDPYLLNFFFFVAIYPFCSYTDLKREKKKSFNLHSKMCKKKKRSTVTVM